MSSKQYDSRKQQELALMKRAEQTEQQSAQRTAEPKEMARTEEPEFQGWI